MNILKKTMLFLTFSLLFFASAFGQELVFGYADFIGGKGFDRIADVCIDRSDNVYVTGVLEKKGTIGKLSLKSESENILFVVKYNDKGEVSYLKELEGESKLSAHALTTDAENNLYLTGSFRKTCYIGEKKLVSIGFQNNFLLKLDPDGNFLWVKQIITDTKNDRQQSACDGKGRIIVSGSFYKGLQIDDRKIKTNSPANLYFAEFGPEGKLLNIMNYEGNGKAELVGLAVSDDNRVFFAGNFTETMQFGETKLQSSGRSDIFWGKISFDENALLKIKQTGGKYDDHASEIRVKNDRVYLAGGFRDKIEFKNKTLVSRGGQDIFLAEYKPNGKEAKIVQIGGKGNDYPHSFVINTKNELYLFGNFRGEIEAGNFRAETKNYQSDNFVLKTDAGLNFKKLIGFGGEDNDFPARSAINANNIVYLIGTYRSDFTFGERKSKTSTRNNIFLSEMYDCENTVLDLGEDIEICGETYELKPDIDYAEYRWSNGTNTKNLYVERSGIYTLQAIDKYGCTAEDEINITLHEVPSVNLGEDRDCTKGEIIGFDAGKGFKTYRWTGSDKSRDFKSVEEKLTVNTENLDEGTYEYSVEITDFNGCICSDTVRIKLKDTGKISGTSAFSAEVLPNPNDGNFTLYVNNINTKEELLFEVYAPNGKQIYKGQAKKREKSLNEKIRLKNTSAGTYLLKIINGTDILNKVIIIFEN